MRRLSAEEAAAWRAVSGSVRALSGKLPPTPKAAHAERSRDTGPKEAQNESPHAQRVSTSLDISGVWRKSVHLGKVAHNTLDGTWDKRLASGRLEPDFSIDLHGETLSSAHARLNRSLDFAIRQDARVILLITGKPQPDNPRLPPTSRGVIRASVKDWIAASPHASQIVAIRGAHPRHGGAGALYLILKRKRA